MKRMMLLLALAGLLAGCDGPAANDPRMKLAEKCREEGDFPAAERQILRYLDAHPDSAEAHLKLASLYDESLSDPVGAAYHYRVYLRLDPGSSQRREVEAWMLAAQKRCAPAQPSVTVPIPVPAPEYARIRQENVELKAEADRLRRELAELRRRPVPGRPAAAPPPRAAAASPASPAPVADIIEYEVKSGDSLGKIAQRFYGNSQKIEPILTANGLTRRSVLHIGQKLKIPQKTR